MRLRLAIAAPDLFLGGFHPPIVREPLAAAASSMNETIHFPRLTKQAACSPILRASPLVVCQQLIPPKGYGLCFAVLVFVFRPAAFFSVLFVDLEL